jgi:hypothetical protein
LTPTAFLADITGRLFNTAGLLPCGGDRAAFSKHSC